MSLPEAFAAQARACDVLGSPFMGRLMTLLAERLTPEHGTLAARMFDWRGDVSAAGQSLPLRLAGGLHALRRAGHAGLAAVYPPVEAEDDALWSAVSQAMRNEASWLAPWLDGPPQTNELRRAAVLRAAGQWLAARFGLPLSLLELGASAGLNLHWDRYALEVGGRRHGPADAALILSPEWSGPPPPAVEPVIAARIGVDLAPVHPTRDRDRLLAYVWPDQPDRLARMRAATALPPAPVEAGDAGAWLAARLAGPPPEGVCRMVAHTIAWQYFPPETAARAEAALGEAGARATAQAPLARFGMEPGGTGRGAALTLTTWPGGETVEAGRVDYHGRWVDWRLT